jgi:hypothetical protein
MEMSSTFDELDRDWRRLRADRRAVTSLEDVCALAGVANLAELEEYVLKASRAAADQVLVALVRRAVADDGLSARVLLQLLLPGVRRLARRWWALGDDDERAAAAVAAVWEKIQHYPVERRPGRVAANILMDATVEVRRSLRGRQLVLPMGFTPGYEPPDTKRPNAAVELVEALVDAVQAGVITRHEAQLIATTRIGGTPLRQMADETGTPLRTLQWHRQCAEAALAGQAAIVA